MANEVSSNSQAAPEVATPPASGNQDAALAARVSELERQSEGRLRDLQEERRKRQELEQRLSAPVSSAAPVENDVAQDEVAKVLTPYLAPIKKQAEEALRIQKDLQAQRQREDAAQFLSEKTGKSRSQLIADTAFLEKLDKVAQKWGIVGSFDEVARRAYEVMELEDFRSQQLEKARMAQTNAQASLPAGAPPASVSSGRRISATDFHSMPTKDFAKSEREGYWRKDLETGEFVYTPRS